MVRNTSKKLIVFIASFGVLLVILLVSQSTRNDEKQIFNNGIDDLLGSYDVGYTSHQKIIYSTNPNIYIEISNDILLDYYENNFEYFKVWDTKEIVDVTLESQEVEKVERFYVYNEEVSSFSKSDDLWIQTVLYGEISQPFVLINQIKDIISNYAHYEVVESESGQIFRFFEMSSSTIKQLETRSCEIYKTNNFIDFTDYQPFYLDILINENGEISIINFSHSSISLLYLLGTGSYTRNDDWSFNSFRDGEFYIDSIDYNPKSFELPIPDKIVHREYKTPI